MSYEDRMDAADDYRSEVAAEAIGDLTATDIMDLFLTLDLTTEQRLEMIEALIMSLNQKGYTYRLVEEE